MYKQDASMVELFTLSRLNLLYSVCVGVRLDYTLWPFWVDTHVTPPFHKRNGCVIDACGQKVKPYPEVPEVLERLTHEGYILAVASRTTEFDGANQLLKLFDWDKYFKFKEIYPGCKVTHFNSISKKSGVSLKDMIFFDDEHRNIHDLTQRGVISILVKNGITSKLVTEGLDAFKNH